MHLARNRGCCITFWPSIPPLQVAPSVTCSVASLSRCPGLQLPRSCSLRHRNSTDNLLGWGEPSTCSADHVALQYIPTPKMLQNNKFPQRACHRLMLVTCGPLPQPCCEVRKAHVRTRARRQTGTFWGGASSGTTPLQQIPLKSRANLCARMPVSAASELSLHRLARPLLLSSRRFTESPRT